MVDGVYRNYFQAACKALKLGNVRLHDLRHTFATLALSAGERRKTAENGWGRLGALELLISGQGLRGPIISPQPIPPIIPPGPIICCIMAGIPSCTNPVTSRACARMT